MKTRTLLLFSLFVLLGALSAHKDDGKAVASAQAQPRENDETTPMPVPDKILSAGNARFPKPTADFSHKTEPLVRSSLAYIDEKGEFEFQYPTDWVIVYDRYWYNDSPRKFDAVLAFRTYSNEDVAVKVWRDLSNSSSISDLADIYLDQLWVRIISKH